MADELQHKDPGSALTQAEYITTDGTGHIFDSQAQGDILYATSTTVLSRLSKSGTSTHSLTNTGTNNNPAWAQVALATGVSGTLPVGNGGTGATTLTDKAVLISQDSGTDTLGSVALTTSGQVIIGGSSGPAAAVLTAGSNVTITNGDGSISIAAAGGAVARVGGEQANQTFTNTSVGDLIDLSSLTIDRAVPFLMTMAVKKDDAGTGNHINIGLKINSTVIGEAVIGNNNIWASTNTDEVQEGVSFVFIGPRATDFQNSGFGFRTTWAGTTRRSTVFVEDPGGETNQWEANADTTNIILRSLTNDPEGAVDEFNVYTFAYGGI